MLRSSCPRSNAEAQGKVAKIGWHARARQRWFDRDEPYRRVAYCVDRILKGAKPPGLPVEQPMKFEFGVNLKTAKQIGVTIPPNVLARADRVIR